MPKVCPKLNDAIRLPLPFQFGFGVYVKRPKTLVIRAGINKMLVRIANSEDPDQKQSDQGLHWLATSFSQSTSVWNVRTSRVSAGVKVNLIRTL